MEERHDGDEEQSKVEKEAMEGVVRTSLLQSWVVQGLDAPINILTICFHAVKRSMRMSDGLSSCGAVFFLIYRRETRCAGIASKQKRGARSGRRTRRWKGDQVVKRERVEIAECE